MNYQPIKCRSECDHDKRKHELVLTSSRYAGPPSLTEESSTETSAVIFVVKFKRSFKFRTFEGLSRPSASSPPPFSTFLGGGMSMAVAAMLLLEGGFPSILFSMWTRKSLPDRNACKTCQDRTNDRRRFSNSKRLDNKPTTTVKTQGRHWSVMMNADQLPELDSRLNEQLHRFQLPSS